MTVEERGETLRLHRKVKMEHIPRKHCRQTPHPPHGKAGDMKIVDLSTGR